MVLGSVGTRQLGVQPSRRVAADRATGRGSIGKELEPSRSTARKPANNLCDGRGATGPSHCAPSALAVTSGGLASVRASECEAQVRRLAGEEAQRPFDLAQGPLVRAMLLRLGEKEYVLLLNMHHIVSDGWSTDVFIREAIVLYNAFSTDEASPLSELPIQYADYAFWQRQWLQGEVLEKQSAYWKQQLTGAPTVLEMPTDRPILRSKPSEGQPSPSRCPRV